jgi:hypothetical protein
MKKVLFVLITVIACINLNATVRTVSNTTSNPGQYSTIEAAVVASSPGDTIYINGSATIYNAPSTVKTNLTFIGAGHNPQKQNPLTTYIAGTFTAGTGYKLIGLILQGLNGNGSNGLGNVISGITIQRCLFYGDAGNGRIFAPNVSIGALSNVLIEECLLFGNGPEMFWANNNDRVYSNLTMRNNIFYLRTTSSVFDKMSNASSGILFDHNIFISPGTSFPVFKAGFSSGTAGISFTNNIFQNTTATIGSSVFSYLNNFSTLENLNINGGANNLQGASPQFVNYPGGEFSYTHNYNLAAGSPCIGTGSNGNDMGIYAGAAPFHWDGVASIPQVTLMNIAGTQVQQGGSINVSFQAVIRN